MKAELARMRSQKMEAGRWKLGSVLLSPIFYLLTSILLSPTAAVAAVGGGGVIIPGGGGGAGGSATNAVTIISSNNVAISSASTNLNFVGATVTNIGGKVTVILPSGSGIPQTPGGAGTNTLLYGAVTNVADVNGVFHALKSTWTSNNTFAAPFTFSQSWQWQNSLDAAFPDVVTKWGYNSLRENYNEPSLYWTFENRWQNIFGTMQSEFYITYETPTNGLGTNFTTRWFGYTPTFNSTNQSFQSDSVGISADLIGFYPRGSNIAITTFSYAGMSGTITHAGQINLTTNDAANGDIGLKGGSINLGKPDSVSGIGTMKLGTDWNSAEGVKPHSYIQDVGANRSLIFKNWTNFALSDTSFTMRVPSTFTKTINITNTAVADAAPGIVFGDVTLTNKPFAGSPTLELRQTDAAAYANIVGGVGGFGTIYFHDEGVPTTRGKVTWDTTLKALRPDFVGTFDIGNVVAFTNFSTRSISSNGYYSGGTTYTRMPTNTPVDGYVFTAVGTDGFAKWAAPGGGATNGIQMLDGIGTNTTFYSGDVKAADMETRQLFGTGGAETVDFASGVLVNGAVDAVDWFLQNLNSAGGNILHWADTGVTINGDLVVNGGLSANSFNGQAITWPTNGATTLTIQVGKGSAVSTNNNIAYTGYGGILASMTNYQTFMLIVTNTAGSGAPKSVTFPAGTLMFGTANPSYVTNQSIFNGIIYPGFGTNVTASGN